MTSILDLVLAVLAALHAHASTPPTPTPPQPPPETAQALPDGWITIHPDHTPWGVTPAEQPAAIAPDGTIHHADGTTTCVTASPCDYTAAQQTPGQPSTLDIDPIWNRPELTPGPRQD